MDASWDIFLIMSVKTENLANLLSIVSDYMFQYFRADALTFVEFE